MNDKFKVGDYILNYYADDEDKVICPICGYPNDTNYDTGHWYCENCDSHFNMVEVNEILRIGKYKNYNSKMTIKRFVVAQSEEGE